MKEILEKLLTYLAAKELIDGIPFRANEGTSRQVVASGLCSMLRIMILDNLIGYQDREELLKFLEEELNKPIYQSYPIRYYRSSQGAQDLQFFFVPDDWSIRKKFLEEVLTNNFK